MVFNLKKVDLILQQANLLNDPVFLKSSRKNQIDLIASLPNCDGANSTELNKGVIEELPTSQLNRQSYRTTV